MESGEWRVESGEWRAESGDWRVEIVCNRTARLKGMPEIEDDVAGAEYFEILHILIPRYLRVIGIKSEGNAEEAYSKLRERLGRLGQNGNLLQRVKWFHSAGFLSLPGYISIHDLDPLSLGLFSFDIASACAVNALGIDFSNEHSYELKESKNILDLCCCPGGKTQMIYDLLDYNLSGVIGRNKEIRDHNNGNNEIAKNGNYNKHNYKNNNEIEIENHKNTEFYKENKGNKARNENNEKNEENISGTLIVGVDISKSRLQVCTILLIVFSPVGQEAILSYYHL